MVFSIRRIPLIEQVVCNQAISPMPPERQDEVGSDGRQHLSVVGKSRGCHLGRPSRDQIGVESLDRNQLYHIGMATRWRR
jgi:hypothetical protein